MMETALSTIAYQNNNGTKSTQQAYRKILDYMATHSNVMLRYVASYMKLAVHSNSSYLSKSNVRIHAGDSFYLTKNNAKKFQNGVMITLPTIVKHVLAPAS